MTKRLGLKCSLTIMFMMSLLGGTLVLFGENFDKSFMPIFVLLSKFGITGMAQIAYTCSVYLFPTLFSATAIGICNLSARILTISAFMIAEMEAPTPMTIFVSVQMLGLILV